MTACYFHENTQRSTRLRQGLRRGRPACAQGFRLRIKLRRDKTAGRRPTAKVFASGHQTKSCVASGRTMLSGFVLDYRRLKPRLYSARSRCANTDMAAEVKKEIQLEIAHVLFTD